MVSNSISDTELLQFAIKSGMLDAALVEEKIEMQKRKALLEKHPYSIWPGKDGKWYTYLPDEEKKRKKALKKRKTKEEIEKLVIDYWEERIEKERIYLFSDAYFMWREVRDQLVDDNTVAKYETDYNRFFKDSEFLVMDIKKINDDTIRIFMFNTIKKCRLQKEPMRKLFGYIKNSILFARKNGILESNPIEFLESKDFSRYCYEVYKPGE